MTSEDALESRDMCCVSWALFVPSQSTLSWRREKSVKLLAFDILSDEYQQGLYRCECRNVKGIWMALAFMQAMQCGCSPPGPLALRWYSTCDFVCSHRVHRRSSTVTSDALCRAACVGMHQVIDAAEEVLGNCMVSDSVVRSELCQNRRVRDPTQFRSG